METDVEIGIVKADCRGGDGEELYWLFSRKQLEFVVKELELVDSGETGRATYMNMVLPVVSLESYFGFSQGEASGGSRYMVLCGVDAEGNMCRIMLRVNGSPRFFKLANSLAAQEGFTTPANDDHYHGAYAIGAGKIVIVPDIVRIAQGLS